MPPKKDKAKGGPAAAPEAQPAAPLQHPEDQCVLCLGEIDLSTEERFAGAHTPLMFAPKCSQRASIAGSSTGAISGWHRPRRIAAAGCGFHLQPPPAPRLAATCNLCGTASMHYDCAVDHLQQCLPIMFSNSSAQKRYAVSGLTCCLCAPTQPSSRHDP